MAKSGSGRDPRLSFQPAPGDVFRECPYDSGHLILGTKMRTHLMKCRNNYEKMLAEQGKPPLTQMPCAFNPDHLVFETELAYHHRYCPYKVEKNYQAERAGIRKYCPKRPKVNSGATELSKSGQDEEDWTGEVPDPDAKSGFTSYPKPPKPDQVTFFHEKNLSKAERKKQRKLIAERNVKTKDPQFVFARIEEVNEDDIQNDDDMGAEGTGGQQASVSVCVSVIVDGSDEQDGAGGGGNHEAESCEKANGRGQSETITSTDAGNSDGSLGAKVGDGGYEVSLENEEVVVDDSASEIYYMSHETLSTTGSDTEEESEDDEFWDVRSRLSAMSVASRH